MLVPRPLLAGASAKWVPIPTPSSQTKSRHALAVDSKPTRIVPLAPPGKACFSALITSSVAIRPMLTACSDVVDDRSGISASLLLLLGQGQRPFNVSEAGERKRANVSDQGEPSY